MIKKICNDPENVVQEALEGFYLSDNERSSELVPGTRFIVRKPEYRKEKGKVKIVGGGGSGHEPVLFTMVGPYANDLMVAGEFFAAPAWKQLYQGIKMVDDGSPILINTSSHAGDILNSRMAFQMLEAEGLNVRMHIDWSDVSSAPRERISERRGLIGGLGRIVGIAAEEGCDLDEVCRLADKARDNNGSYAVGIRSAINPITGDVIMPMKDDEIMLGIGQHGESSGVTMKMPTSKELARHMADKIIDDMGFEKGDELVVYVNNLGGLTYMEMGIFYRDLHEYLTKEKGFRIFEGRFGPGVTTQELAGMILSLGKVDDDIRKYWTPSI